MAIRRNACSLLALPDFPEFAPGSREVLPLPRRLRTGRESFPSSSSSLHERPLRGAVASVRFFLHVDLSMTVGMHQLQVVSPVRTASTAPDTMVDLAVFLCYPQRLTANHASSLLFLPAVGKVTATKLTKLGYLGKKP